MGKREKMKFYGHPLSPFSRVVELTLAINKQDAEFQHLKLFQGEQHSEWFLKINPKHKVPTLVDGDFVLTESTVIAKYLCNKLGGTPLYPSDPQSRAKIDELIQELQSIDVIFIGLTRVIGLVDYGSEENFLKSIRNFAASRMSKPGFLLGELTLADLVLATGSSCWEKYDPEYNLSEKCPEMAAHLAYVIEKVPEWGPIEERRLAFFESEAYKNRCVKNYEEIWKKSKQYALLQ